MLLRVNDLMMSIFEGDTSLRSRLDDTVESTVYGPYLSTKVKKINRTNTAGLRKQTIMLHMLHYHTLNYS